jgi:glutamate racemase
LIAEEIAPCFIDAGGRRTDTIVLACTHYPLLIERLTRLAPWPVNFMDPAPAIARRVLDLSGPPSASPPAPARIAFTSGAAPSAALAAALKRFGLVA